MLSHRRLPVVFSLSAASLTACRIEDEVSMMIEQPTKARVAY